MIAVASRGAALLPAATAHRLAVIGGTAEWALRPAKRQVLSANLRRAAPHADSASLRRLVRAEVINEARRSADLLWSLDRPDALLADLRLENDGPVRRLLESGRGIILAGPHIGGWEIVSGAPGAFFDVGATVVATDDWLAWAMERFRSRGGLRIAYATRPPVDLVHRLRAGEMAILFADLVPPGTRTVTVQMLACDLDLPAGPATLARMSDAMVVPLAVLPAAPRVWRVVFGDPIEPPPRSAGRAGEQHVMQLLADVWSAWLRAHPEHWAAVYPLAWGAPRPLNPDPRRIQA